MAVMTKTATKVTKRISEVNILDKDDLGPSRGTVGTMLSLHCASELCGMQD